MTERELFRAYGLSLPVEERWCAQCNHAHVVAGEPKAKVLVERRSETDPEIVRIRGRAPEGIG